MTNYIDGFVLPIPKKHLDEYKRVVEKVAKIWKEHGAVDYQEFVGDDLELEGTRHFPEAFNANKDEVIVFGWVVFKSREARDKANKLVLSDPRMTDIVAPLTNSKRIIFDASKMVYGGFKSLLDLNRSESD